MSRLTYTSTYICIYIYIYIYIFGKNRLISRLHVPDALFFPPGSELKCRKNNSSGYYRVYYSCRKQRVEVSAPFYFYFCCYLCRIPFSVCVLRDDLRPLYLTRFDRDEKPYRNWASHWFCLFVCLFVCLLSAT